MPPIPAMQEAAHELITEQCQRIAIPKRFTMPIREIWDMQERLPRRSGKRADMLLDNPRFRAGYDFLLLRESAGEQTNGLGEWWTEYQDANDSGRRDMIRDLSNAKDDGAAPFPIIDNPESLLDVTDIPEARPGTPAALHVRRTAANANIPRVYLNGLKA